MWGTPGIVKAPSTHPSSSDSVPSTSTSSTHPDSKLYPSKNTFSNDSAVNHVAGTTTAPSNHLNPPITITNGHNQTDINMHMIDVKIKEVSYPLRPSYITSHAIRTPLNRKNLSTIPMTHISLTQHIINTHFSHPHTINAHLLFMPYPHTNRWGRTFLP